MSGKKVSVLVARIVLNHLQSIGEFNGTKLMLQCAHYTHISTYLFLHIVLVFCHSPLLLLVAREQYQMNAGSYLVTLLISCGPALPCGCCSRDDGDEEEEGRGGLTAWLLLRQQCCHTGVRGL